MDTAVESAPSIIEAAAQSTLGILALLILTVGAIAYLFFRESGDRVKVVIFSMIFVGAAGFGLVVVSKSSEAEPRPDVPRPVPQSTPGDGPRHAGGDSVADPVAGPDVPPEPLAPDRTQIMLAYLGDFYGCALDLQVQLGDRAFVPQGNVFQANDVLEGRQPYEIEGTIGCPAIGGWCEAWGEGTLDVQPNASYNIVWQGTDSEMCDVILQRGQ